LDANVLYCGFDKIRQDNWTIYINKYFRSSTFEQLLTRGQKEFREHYPATTIPSSEFAHVYKFTVRFEGIDTEVYLKQYVCGSILHLVKQLFRTSRAKRAFKATLMLAENDFLAPTVVAMGEYRLGPLRTKDFLVTLDVADSKRIYELITESRTDSPREHRRDKRKLLRAFGRTIGKMHAKGIFHGDLRLGNVLTKQEGHCWRFFFLDNERTKKFCRLAVRLQVKNLVQVNMKLPDTLTNTDRMRFFKEYWTENGGDSQQKRELVRQVVKRSDRRLDEKKQVARELRKCLRTNERYLRVETDRYLALFERSFCQRSEAVTPVDFVEQIDALMDEGQILKQDNTSYVSRLTLNGRDVVVKRYNHRGLIHSIRHTIKKSRAERSWLHAHRLGVLGIATPKPMAYIEQYKGMLVWKSYIVTECVEGPRLYDILRDGNVAQEERSMVCQQLTDLLSELDKYGITHGDLKHANILITDNGPVLMDLDGMRAHRCNWLFRISRRRDINRLTKSIASTR